MHNTNQFDMDLARRMAFASLLSAPAAFFVAGTMYMLLVLTFGPVLAAIVAMASAAVIVGIIGNWLEIVDFPIVELFRDEQISDNRKRDLSLRTSVTGAALPLSFSSSFLWAMMGSMAFPGSIASVILVLAIPAGCLSLTIICSQGATEPKQSLYASGKAFALMMLFVVVY